MLKQIEPKIVNMCDASFAIYPFPAMKSASLSGELGKFFGPLVAGCLPLIAVDSDEDVLDLDIKNAMPLVTSAFSSLSGDSVEKILTKLLLDGNIAVSYTDPSTGEKVQSRLNRAIFDELFCQDIGEAYRLAYEVINLNFKGFFKKLLGQSGKLNAIIEKIQSGSTENLTQADSQSSN